MAEEKTLTLVYDLDKTLCTKKLPNETYLDVKPIQPMIDQLNKFYDMGYNIIIQTARNMVTQHNDVGRVIQNIGEDTLRWLREHGVKYHSIHFGKPYGHYYCDDKSVRPHELLMFDKMNAIEELDKYLKNENDLSVINKSINFIFNKHYVYQWYYYFNNEKIIFYVGKGIKFRAWDTKGRNDVFKKIYNTYDCNVEIIETFNNDKDARKYELELQYKYIDMGQCKACLDDNRGRISPMKGKPAWNRSEYYTPKKKHPLGKKQPKSLQHKEKIKLSNIGKHNHKNSKNPMSKLNESIVIEICKLLNNNVDCKIIAKQFNVSKCTIDRIKYGYSWKEVSNLYLNGNENGH